MDVARSTSVRKAWQLWPEAIPKDFEGDCCYTEVAIWLEKRKGLENCYFVSLLWGQIGGKRPVKSVFNFQLKVLLGVKNTVLHIHTRELSILIK